ncbi:MAG: TonB-dependent receptor [Muribaculaceae bacterium]|nr:TonB-dependent receptor [Muribaculaceae bacterium]
MVSLLVLIPIDLNASKYRPLLLAVSTTAGDNTLNVSGKVLDDKGEAVVGATIMEKGTNNGVTTDVEGKFNCKVKQGATLKVSSVGFKHQELKAKNDIKIVLESELTELDEVIVVGYGTQKKKLITGATVQVKGEDISKLNTVDVMGALQSQSPGVNITQVNGFLGQGFTVNVRGIGTIGNSSPLFVIDGVANASIDGLNPSDIESIDILKDAASAAIYGARGANGVILVTTKRGKDGHSVINYDGYVGIQNLYKIPHILDAQEYMSMQDEARVMDGLQPNNWSAYIPQRDLKAIANGSWNGTNWLKEIQNKNALVQNHSLGFSGGNSMGNYSIGLSYTNQEATMGVPSAIPNLNRYNFRVNSEKVVKRLNGLDFIKIGETINYKYQQMRGSFGTGGLYWNGVHNMLVMSPLMHAYNANGEYYTEADRVADNYTWDISSGNNKNPIAYMDYMANQNESSSHYLQSSFFVQIQPIKNLRFKSLFGYIMSNSDYRSYVPTYNLTSTINATSDRVSQSKSNSHRWSWENTLNYTFDILNDHHFDALIGQSIEKWGFGGSMSGSMSGSNFNDFKHGYLSNISLLGTNVSSLTGYPNAQGALSSFFGRINYNYNEKYMASVIMRADGSSVFAPGHRWGYFPSVSVGWVMSNEDFMESTSSWLNFLKIRGSWGQNGNCAVSTFQYLSLISSNNGYGGYSFGDSMDLLSTASYAYKLTNPNLKWETQEQLDLGFDARLLQNRLSVEFDWYNRTTKDWLVTAPVLTDLGADAPAINGGNITNKGFELALRWNDNIGKDFSYGISYNVAYNKNEVTKIANADGIIHGASSIFWEGADECYRAAEVGKPVGYFFGYKSAGIFQNQKQIDEYPGPFLNGKSNTHPGDVIWVDNDNNGVIDSDDRTEIGNPHPKFTMGFAFNLQWKALDLSVTTYAALGHQVMKCYRDFVSSPLNNYTSDILGRWHGEGTSNKLPRLSSSDNSNWNRISDIYVENADFLKIQNITLGFDFKKQFNKIPFEQLRIYATVQNPYTFTKYSGMDPEIGFGGEGAGSYVKGIDLGYYPSSRNILFGVNIKY